MVDAKKRSKAMKVAVAFSGVISAQVDDERITVVGDGVDPVALTVMLRKKMCYAELVSVGAAEEKKEEKKDGGNKCNNVPQMIWPCQVPIMPQHIICETPYNERCRMM